MVDIYELKWIVCDNGETAGSWSGAWHGSKEKQSCKDYK